MEYFEYSNNCTYAVCKEDLRADFFNGMAVPVESRIRLGYGDNAEEYLNSGARDVQIMLNILEKNNVNLPANVKCLDFGCGGGRMLRHIPTYLPDGLFWGCDTESRAISWAQTYLDNKFRFFTNLREPHLPFEDGYFDFIYAGSVFSHLNDMAEFWMLELRRITKPETGILYLTFQDDGSIELIRKQNTAATKHYYNNLFFNNENEFLFDRDYKKIVVGRDKYSSQVFYKTSWLNILLSQYFCDVKLVPAGYGWQTAAILKK